MVIDAQQRKKVEQYIRDQYEKGHTFEIIERKLVEHGYPKSFARQVIKKQVRMGKQNHPLLSKGQIVTGIIMLLIVLVFLVFLKMNIPSTCDRESCFLERAQACKATVYTTTANQLTYEFLVDRDCTLTKKVIAVDESEPEFVQNLLLGKSMVCTYEKGNFNENYISTMLSGITTCQGPLKEAFYELVLIE